MTIANTVESAHPWERMGLGKAPYRYLGASVEKFQACQGAPIQPAGSCDVCGQAIWTQVRFESADGKRFKVGCDCAERAGVATKQIDALKRKHQAQLRAARKVRKVAAAALAHAELLTECEGYADMGRECPSSFVWTMARSIAATIRAGKSPSEKQLAAYTRAKAEVGL